MLYMATAGLGCQWWVIGVVDILQGSAAVGSYLSYRSEIHVIGNWIHPGHGSPSIRSGSLKPLEVADCPHGRLALELEIALSLLCLAHVVHPIHRM